MAPTSQEIMSIIVIMMGVIIGIAWFLKAIKREEEERKSEVYRLWHNF